MKEKKCPITGDRMNYLFSNTILNKYDVSYFESPSCKLVQTEEPYWLDEAYSSAITKLDIGLASRNIRLSKIVYSIIRFFLKIGNGRFLDYAGGYGMLARLCRDMGLDYYSYDPYCENLFSADFQVEPKKKFDLITAFEFAEHITDPIKEFTSLSKNTDNILFSTEIIPEIDDLRTWWYISAETGQHVTLYSMKSLEEIANKIDMKLYSNGKNLHLFSRVNKVALLFKFLSSFKVSSVLSAFRKDTLLMRDYEFIKDKIKRDSN